MFPTPVYPRPKCASSLLWGHIMNTNAHLAENYLCFRLCTNLGNVTYQKIICIEGVCTCALQQVKPKTESHLLDLYSCERPKICCFYHWIDKMYWTCQNYSCLLYSHHFQAGLQDIDFTCCFICFPKLCVYVWIYLFRNYQHTLNFLWSDSFAYGLFFAPK
jgi:hypothetical protein